MVVGSFGGWLKVVLEQTQAGISTRGKKEWLHSCSIGYPEPAIGKCGAVMCVKVEMTCNVNYVPNTEILIYAINGG